jgi:hypothetical protein
MTKEFVVAHTIDLFFMPAEAGILSMVLSSSSVVSVDLAPFYMMMTE